MNWTNLRNDVDFLCGSTSATYLIADKHRNMNAEYQRVATLIWESDPTYAWDDRNNTDYNIATRTVANASGSYLIPTTALMVRGVEIKDGSGNWQKLTPITYEELPVSPEEYLAGVGTPARYMLEGTQIRLFPAPGTGYVTMSSGMAVHLNRAVTEAATSATTTEPGFAAPFHRILSYAAAIDFVNDESDRNHLLQQKARLEAGLTRFYGKWASQFKGRVKPQAKAYWRRYT